MNPLPIDIWCVILSNADTVDFCDTFQLTSIMTMSLVNKELNNMIINNTFWILYDNSKYCYAQFNIYKSMQMFLKIIKSLKELTFEKLIKYDLSIYHTIPIITDNTTSSTIIDNCDLFDPTIHNVYFCFRKYIENEYCMLCNGLQNDLPKYKRVSIIYKKYLPNNSDDMPENTINKYEYISLEMLNLIKIHNIDDLQEIIDSSPVLYNNYIFYVSLIYLKDILYKITFYAHNIFTNVKYKVHQIEIHNADTLSTLNINFEVNTSTLSLLLHPPIWHNYNP